MISLVRLSQLHPDSFIDLVLLISMRFQRLNLPGNLINLALLSLWGSICNMGSITSILERSVMLRCWSGTCCGDIAALHVTACLKFAHLHHEI
jgi:hypothetical protein